MGRSACQRRHLAFLLCAAVTGLLASLQTISSIQSYPWLGMRFYRAYYDPTYLSGRGSPGLRRAAYRRPRPVGVWQSILERGSDRQLRRLIRMTIAQFEELIEDLRLLPFPAVGLGLSFEDKVLLVFIWLVKYPDYSELATQFGTSVTLVSRIVTGYLDVLCAYFSQFIPDKEWNTRKPSTLSNRIVAIVDGTLHAVRKPAHRQHLAYSGHYKTHGMLTHLLVDFDGFIISLQTNILGSVHDSNAALHNYHFPKILGMCCVCE